MVCTSNIPYLKSFHLWQPMYTTLNFRSLLSFFLNHVFCTYTILMKYTSYLFLTQFGLKMENVWL